MGRISLPADGTLNELAVLRRSLELKDLKMAEIKPRYEFRIWGDILEPFRKRLEALAQPGETISEETYLVSTTEKSNVKIRYGLMDIKVLVAVDRGLEQWKPILKAEFPLSATAIADQVFPSLKLEPPPLGKDQYSMEEFFAEVVRAEPKIAVVDVSKTRFQFGIGVCAAEYARVTINQVPRDTVAVESTDPDAVLQLVKDLGIDQPNVSYIHEISRILGGGAV